jgi:mono/diheme cytochrome c family protein
MGVPAGGPVGKIAPVRRASALAALTALALFAAACGGGENKTPTPEGVEGEIPQQTVGEGNPAAGEEVWNAANPGCGTCHTFDPAGASGNLGPNLDDTLEGQDRQQVFESIVNPDAEISEGFDAGVMPKDYGEKLNEKQLADLVAFLTES